MRDWTSSQAEKQIARKAFDLAVSREFDFVIAETKERSSRITKADELWKLERWLSERHKEIDNKYDYRYSVLPIVFGRLLCEGRLTESDLSGLAPEKIDHISRMAQFMRDE